MIVVAIAYVTGAGAISAASEVVGANGHQVFNTLLNLGGVAAAAFAAQLIRDLKAKTEQGDTPAAENTFELRQAVVELREITVSIREGLGKAGVIEQRTEPRS